MKLFQRVTLWLLIALAIVAFSTSHTQLAFAGDPFFGPDPADDSQGTCPPGDPCPGSGWPF